jgi:hypothetical protein
MNKAIRIIILMCCALIFSFKCAYAQRTTLTPSDFSYTGCFQLPANVGSYSTVQGNGLALRLVGGVPHLFSLAGWHLYEVVVPTPSLTFPGPNATLSRDWSTGGSMLVVGQDADYNTITALYWDPISSYLYYSATSVYQGSGDSYTPTMARITLNDSAGTFTADGFWGFQNRSFKQVNYGFTAVPPDFAKQYLPTICSSSACTSGSSTCDCLAAGFGGYQSVLSFGPVSFGPALTAFAPPAAGTGCSVANVYTNQTSASYPGACSTSNYVPNMPLVGYGESITEAWTSGSKPTYQRCWRDDAVLTDIWTDVNDPDGSINADSFSGDETFYWQGYSTTVQTRQLAGFLNNVPSKAIATKHWVPGNAFWASTDEIFQAGAWIQTANKEGLVIVPTLTAGNNWYQNSAWHVGNQKHLWMIYSRSQLASVAAGAQESSIQPTWYPLQFPGLDYPLPGGGMTSSGIYNVVGMAYDSTNQNLYIAVQFASVPTGMSSNGQTVVYVYHVNDPSVTQYTITVNAGSAGTVWPNGPVLVNSGQTQLFEIIPNAPTTTATVSGCGGSIINQLYSGNNGVSGAGSASVAFQTGAITSNCTVTVFGGGSVNPSLTPPGTPYVE